MDGHRSHLGYRYCPECRSEYRPGFEMCAECGVYLVHELSPEPEAAPREAEPHLGPNPVAVFTCARDLEAEMVRGVLEGCGIAARVWSSGYEAYTGRGVVGQIAGTAAGLGYRVMVRAEDADLAREIVAAEPEVGRPPSE